MAGRPSNYLPKRALDKAEKRVKVQQVDPINAKFSPIYCAKLLTVVGRNSQESAFGYVDSHQNSTGMSNAE